MMKIAKQALLFGAFAMLFSTVPMQAMETVEEDVMVTQDVPADVQAEVTTKRGFFAGWDKDAINERLKNAMDELDKLWKKFMKCIKGDEGCPRSLVWAIRGTILTILALVMKGRIQRGAEWISRQVVPPIRGLGEAFTKEQRAGAQYRAGQLRQRLEEESPPPMTMKR